MGVDGAHHTGMDEAFAAGLQRIRQVERIGPVGGVGKALDGTIGKLTGVDQQVRDRRGGIGVDQRARAQRQAVAERRDGQVDAAAALQLFGVDAVKCLGHVLNKGGNLWEGVLVGGTAREGIAQVRHDFLDGVAAGKQRICYWIHLPESLMVAVCALLAEGGDEFVLIAAAGRPLADGT